MSEDGSAPEGEMTAPVVGAGSAQEVVDVQENMPPPAVPLREDQIQNAVAFLSHPKVCSSCSCVQRFLFTLRSLDVERARKAHL